MTPDHILQRYQEVTPTQARAGASWYAAANGWVLRLSRTHGYSPERVAGVVAVMSSQKSWKYSLVAAHRVMKAHKAGRKKPPSVHLKTQVRKAWNILNGQDPYDAQGANAHKTKAFYLNMLGYREHVTIDRWALRALGYDIGQRTPHLALYRKAANTYIQAAEMLRIPPSTLQAILWVAERER